MLDVHVYLVFDYKGSAFFVVLFSCFFCMAPLIMEQMSKETRQQHQLYFQNFGR